MNGENLQSKNLARQEPNTTPIRLLFHSNKQNRANLKSKEHNPINVTPKRVLIEKKI